MCAGERGDLQLERGGELRGESRQRGDHGLPGELRATDGDGRAGDADGYLRDGADRDVSGGELHGERIDDQHGQCGAELQRGERAVRAGERGDLQLERGGELRGGGERGGVGELYGGVEHAECGNRQGGIGDNVWQRADADVSGR